MFPSRLFSSCYLYLQSDVDLQPGDRLSTAENDSAGTTALCYTRHTVALLHWRIGGCEDVRILRQARSAGTAGLRHDPAWCLCGTRDQRLRVLDDLIGGVARQAMDIAVATLRVHARPALEVP